MLFRRSRLSTSIGLLLFTVSAQAGTYSWVNVTGNWSTNAFWTGNVAPSGLDPTDELEFGGPVSPVWTATNDIAAQPFQLNRLLSFASDPGATQNAHTINGIPGSALRFSGSDPQILINNTGSLNLNLAVQLPKPITVGGSGTGRVTINGAISGFNSITKSGSGTLRFGTLPPGVGLIAPSMNTWMGPLILQGGSVQFNNNAQSGATALRAIPITLSAGTLLQLKRTDDDEQNGYETSLRIGTLNGTDGSVIARVVDESASQTKSVSNYDIVITALSNGTYGGTLTLDAPVNNDVLNPGNDGGKFIVRGTATQTLTGTLSIYKDVVVGRGATLKLAGSAALGTPNPNSGAVVLAGGTLILDNTVSNSGGAGRLRDGSDGSTAVETVGGGTLSLVGNALGSAELTGRLQLGTSNAAGNRPRSGALTLNVTHNAGTNGATELRFQSYVRKEDVGPQFATVNFTANDGTGAVKALGSGGNNPRILLSNGVFTVPTFNTLLNVTAGTPAVGWATVNGNSFAAYNVATGITATGTTDWSLSLNSTSNALITVNAATPASSSIVNSIKIAPASAGQSLNITGAGNLSSAAYLLAGGLDFIINSTGGGGLAGTSTRFFHVQQANLTVNANLAPLPNVNDNKAVVKAGAGVLEITNPGNVNMVSALALNAGTVRANHTTGALPGGEIQFRGGVLELAGGGTFTRLLGIATSPGPSVNWSGVFYNSTGGTYVGVDDDRGSGGFAAIGADVTIALTTAVPSSLISWEDMGFLRSGHALILGSSTATHRVTWSNNLGLTDAAATTVNYNAREVRVVNNPNATGDWARVTGQISGSLHNDLLKTGDGTLELAHPTANTYQGATIVQEGTLLVNTDNSASFAHVVKAGATLGGNGLLGTVRIEAGGILAPGNLSGFASILKTGDLSFADGTSILAAQVGGANAGGDTTTGYDQLNVTGAVQLNGADLDLQMLGGYLANQNDILFLILNDGLDSVEGQFADGNQITVGGQLFSISYVADSASVSFTGGNDVALRLIPEPATTLLLGLGAFLCARRRRR
jgi:autotransporter-associated beta strand protein